MVLDVNVMIKRLNTSVNMRYKGGSVPKQTVRDLIEYMKEEGGEEILDMPLLICDGANTNTTILSTYVVDGVMCIDIGD